MVVSTILIYAGHLSRRPTVKLAVEPSVLSAVTTVNSRMHPRLPTDECLLVKNKCLLYIGAALQCCWELEHLILL